MIGLLLSALSPFKMILFWGLKKTPLLLENPALKDHLRFWASARARSRRTPSRIQVVLIPIKYWNPKFRVVP